MKSAVRQRSVVSEGHKTSVSIEESFWVSLREIAGERTSTLSSLVGSIEAGRAENSNLSSAIRVYILLHLQRRLAEHLEARVAPGTTAQDRSLAARAAVRVP